jgi:hypothetical protein
MEESIDIKYYNDSEMIFRMQRPSGYVSQDQSKDEGTKTPVERHFRFIIASTVHTKVVLAYGLGISLSPLYHLPYILTSGLDVVCVHNSP